MGGHEIGARIPYRLRTRANVWLCVFCLVGVLVVGAQPAAAGFGACAQPVSSGALPVASDCLFILHVAIALTDCEPHDPCVCAPDGSSSTTATDALRCLVAAIGSDSTLACGCAGPNGTAGTIGPEGGTLQTTDDDGTAYTLTIPADAIPTGLTIAMTPNTAIDGYPLAGGVVAGVELEPSGTVFATPVTLEVETTATPDVGRVPVAILFSGDGPSFERSFVATGAGTFAVPMLHFSGGTVGFATAQELESLAASQTVGGCILATGLPDVAAIHARYRSCFQSDVLPPLEAATDDVQLATAIGNFVMWKIDSRLALGVDQFTTFDDVAETAQYFDALVGKLQEAIIRDNQRCEEQQSLASLAAVLFWQTQATRCGLDSVANLLDRATILRNLCAHAVVDNLVIPDDIQVGFPHSLDIQLGLLFNGQQDSQGVPFEVTLTADGVNIQRPNGFTDAQGNYTTVITATRDGDLSITARSCLVFPGTKTASDVCVEETATTSAIDLTGNWTGAGGSFCAILSQNQNAISGTIHLVAGKTIALLATLSGSQILGLSLDGDFGEAVCTASGSGTATNDTIALTFTFDEPPCNTSISFSLDFTRGGICP